MSVDVPAASDSNDLPNDAASVCRVLLAPETKIRVH